MPQYPHLYSTLVALLQRQIYLWLRSRQIMYWWELLKNLWRSKLYCLQNKSWIICHKHIMRLFFASYRKIWAFNTCSLSGYSPFGKWIIINSIIIIKKYLPKFLSFCVCQTLTNRLQFQCMFLFLPSSLNYGYVDISMLSSVHQSEVWHVHQQVWKLSEMCWIQ